MQGFFVVGGLVLLAVLFIWLNIKYPPHHDDMMGGF